MSTRSSDLRPLDVVAARLGLAAAHLTHRRLARGVTHDTIVVEDRGVPVAVLRLAPAEDVELPGLDVREEGELLAGLDTPGVPRPELLLHDPGGELLGRPGIVLRHVAGDTPQTWAEVDRDGGDAVRRDALEALLALHRAALSPPGAGHGLDGSARARLDALRPRAAGTGAPGALARTLDRLAREVPDPPAAAWAHGDFRPSNLIVRDGRVAAVLDWEMAGRGDPARDLGIATMREWGVWWPDEELLARYRDGGGADVALASLRWWRCLGYAMVVGFLSSRRAAGWGRGPAIDGFVEGLLEARRAWEAVA